MHLLHNIGNLFNSTFHELKNYEGILKDNRYPRILFEKFKIKLDSKNELSLCESSLLHKKEIKKIWKYFLKYCDDFKRKTIEKINNSTNVIVIKVGSKMEQENMIDLFDQNNIKFKKESTRDSYFNLQTYLKVNEECKELDCILLLATSSYFTINSEYGMCLYEER